MPLSLSHRALKASVRAFEKITKAVSESLYLKIAIDLNNELDLTYRVATPQGSIFIKCLSETVRIRARDMLTREPETIEWIDSFEAGHVFWDLGSNIGVFTLYAAVVKGVRVVAFDPLPHNYYALIENLSLNGVTGSVQAYCAAVTVFRSCYLPADSFEITISMKRKSKAYVREQLA